MSFLTCFCDLPQKLHLTRSPPSPNFATSVLVSLRSAAAHHAAARCPLPPVLVHPRRQNPGCRPATLLPPLGAGRASGSTPTDNPSCRGARVGNLHVDQAAPTASMARASLATMTSS